MPLTFVKIFIIAGVIVIVFFIRAISSEKKIKRKQIKYYPDKLGINLDNCELITGRSLGDAKVPNYLNTIGTFSDFIFNPSETGQKDGTVIYVKYTLDNMVFFSGPIYKSKIAVQALFMQKKTTYIYYNKLNVSDYFFDLNFLEDE